MATIYAFCVAAFGTMIGAAIPNQAAAMQAVALGGFLLVFMLSRPDLSHSEHPRQIPLALQFHLGPLLHRDRARRSSQGGGWPAVWWKVLIIGVIGTVFLYCSAWRNMRRMQLKA